MFLFKHTDSLKQVQLATGLLFLLYCQQHAIASRGELQTWSSDNMADEFTLPDLENRLHVLSSYKGKVVLVNFWASWCRPCVEEMPDLTQLKKQLAGQPFEIFAINTGESKYKVAKFIRRIKFSLPVLLDPSSKAFNKWNINILPTSFLVDGHGQIRYRARGNPDWNHEETIALIEKLITETTIATKPNN